MDSDYSYFFCPKCGDIRVMQNLDFEIVKDGPVEYAKEDRPKAKRVFTIAF
jgi:hypothetical protein